MTLDGLPRNHYGAILADPPWHFAAWSSPTALETRLRNGSKNYGSNRGPTYQTADEGELAALPVADLARENCVLFMWVCWPVLEQSLRLLKAWGFAYKTCGFSWMKADQYRLFALEEDVRMGLGYWTRSNSEVCLLATRGKPKRLNPDVRQGIIEPIREHSRKPDCVHERIERLVAGPYLELFARQKRPGWDCWGNETDKFQSPAPDYGNHAINPN
jgi:N6-adenosine-specific RNA methylase IME4